MECRLKAKKCMEQRMGPLPDHRVEVGAMFQSVAVDLFGPIKYQETVNKRKVGKRLGGGVRLHYNISCTHRICGYPLHR
jgi:hypothetical protein